MNKPLPRIKSLEFTKELPLSKKTVVYRPYNVGDERKLIAAASAKSSDKAFYVNNTLDVIQGAIVNDVSINKLPAIDVKLLLLLQRAKSVGEFIEIVWEGKEASINIEDIRVEGVKTTDQYKIDLGDGIGIQMQDLTFEDEMNASANVDADSSEGKKADVFYQILISSIKAIYTADDVWTAGVDITRKQVEEFLNDIPSGKSKELYDFIADMPRLVADIMVEGKTITVSDKEVDFLSSAQTT